MSASYQPPPFIAESPKGTLFETLDLPWIEGFSPSPESAAEIFSDLSQLARIGSIPLRAIVASPAREAAFEAREEFYRLLGLEGITIKLKQFARARAYLAPVSNFIDSQRFLTDTEFDVVPLIDKHPSALNFTVTKWINVVEYWHQRGFTPEYVKLNSANVLIGRNEILDRLRKRDTVIDSLRAQKSHPNLIYYSDKEIDDRVAEREALGISKRALQRQPTILTCRLETVEARINNLIARGFDATSLINREPAIATLSPRRINSKLDNIALNGIDPAKIVNKYPKILTSGEESVTAKFRLIQRGAKLLGWQGSAIDLVHNTPSLLSFNMTKLLILLRALAQGASPVRSNMGIGQIRTAAIVPVEYYIIALCNPELSLRSTDMDVIALAKKESNRQYTAQERQEAAKLLVAERTELLGRVATLYKLRTQHVAA